MLAKEIAIPLLAIAQLSREAERRPVVAMTEPVRSD